MTDSPSTEENASTVQIVEPQPPRPDYRIEDLPEGLRETIQAMGWQDLMLVQKKSIPYILNAEDLVVQSKTGSGKTGAFALALLQIVEPKVPSTQVLVMVPTRELAVQVSQDFSDLAKNSPVFCTAIYGGVGYKSQLDDLKKGAHVVVGTPGRILDHLIQGNLVLKNLRDLVLDEADEMLSMGFYPDMKRILQYLPRERCTYLFSATMPTTVKRLAAQFQKNPKSLNLCPSTNAVAEMDRIFYKVQAMEKDKALLEIIELENPDSAIIFCNTKKDVHYIGEYLENRGLPVGVMSGDVNQAHREKILKSLKAKQLRFLVATDVAARGIDVQGLSHVFLYDQPDDPETYVHRSGRTARAGSRGVAISLVTSIEEISLNKTAKQYGIQFIEKKLASEDNFLKMVQERAAIYLEQEFRDLKKHDQDRSLRMMPLVDELVQSEEEKRTLGMLLHRFYWSRFMPAQNDSH